MKNICFVLTNMKSGGLQRNAAILANHFSSLGHSVYICCLYSTENFFELDNKVEILDFTTNKNKFASLSIWKKSLSEFFKEKRVDTVISFGERCGILTSRAVKGINVNHICRGVNTKTTLLNKLFLNINVRRINTFVFQTNAQKNLYNKRISERGIVISNPFFLQKGNINSNGVSSKRFVTVASFKLKQKRQDIMIEAFSVFSKDHPDFTFELYGECDENTKKTMTDLIEKKDLTNKVRLMGESKNIKETIVPCRAFICTSTYEGMPNALIEALSYGIPVITTKWSGYDEIIEDGINGIVCEMNNVEQIANAMELISSKDEIFEKISSNSWTYKISSFSKEKVFEIWDKII